MGPFFKLGFKIFDTLLDICLSTQHQVSSKIFDTLSDIYLTTRYDMDAFKGKYERTSAEQYDEFMKVHRL